jgi:hypothetical protein
MIPFAEAQAQRRITTEFIQADVSEIILMPRTKVSNGSGGFTWEEEDPRTSQYGRIIPLTSNAPERMNSDGQRVIVEFILIMEYDAEVGKFDRFTARGRLFEVLHIQEKQDYQTKAELIVVV